MCGRICAQSSATLVYNVRPCLCTKLGCTGIQCAAEFVHRAQPHWYTMCGCVCAQSSAALVSNVRPNLCTELGCIGIQCAAVFVHKTQPHWYPMCSRVFAQNSAALVPNVWPKLCTELSHTARTGIQCTNSAAHWIPVRLSFVHKHGRTQSSAALVSIGLHAITILTVVQYPYMVTVPVPSVV